MSLTIPDEVLETIGMSETELIRETAIILVEQKKLGIARASRLAGINLLEFRRLLAARHIAVGYGIDEFKEDLYVLQQVGEH